MIYLNSDRLTAEIPYPGEDINRTIRFARAAFIKQVTLDGTHTFCGPEPVRAYLPRSGGAGICSEIKANELIKEAPVGGKFPKFGVGLLTKPDEADYNFRRKYACEPFKIRTEISRDTAVFRTEMPACMGYCLEDTRRVAVKGNELEIRYRFVNTGEKPLELGEYCHNFIHIDENPIGSDYYLEMALKRRQDGCRAKEPEGKTVGKGMGYTWSGYDEHPCSLFVDPKDIAEKDFYWKLSHAKNPCTVSEYTSFRPARILLWCVDFNISPECYHVFRLEPGAAVEYWRRWVFTNQEKET